MKFIINILKRIIPEKPRSPLGRWNIDHCYQKNAQKIDWSNEDHCGPCGTSDLATISKVNETKNLKNQP